MKKGSDDSHDTQEDDLGPHEGRIANPFVPCPFLQPEGANREEESQFQQIIQRKYDQVYRALENRRQAPHVRHKGSELTDPNSNGEVARTVPCPQDSEYKRTRG